MRNIPPLCGDYRIGTSLVGMQPLKYLDIPDPLKPPFDEVQERNVRGDLSIRGDGFPSAEWRWEALSRFQFNTLMNFISAGEASGAVYIKTLNNLYAGESSFASYSAMMARSQMNGQDGEPADRGASAFNNVVVRFSALIAQ